MKKIQILLLFIIILLSACSNGHVDDVVQDGVYIREIPMTEQLNGDWEFYWNELLSPGDIKKAEYPSAMLVDVPSLWTDYEVDGNGLPNQGYATYRLHMEFAESEIGTSKALYIPAAASAYKLWISGEPKAESGKVGTSRDSMSPNHAPQMVQFQVHDHRIELVMQVSNFNQRKAGVYQSILIGEPETIAQYRERKLLFRSMIVVSLVVMGLYHIALFAVRKKDLSLIFFGLVCLLVAIRAVILDGILASYTLAFLNWDWRTKLEYLGASLGILLFTFYTYTQFPNEMNTKVRNVITFLMGAYSLMVILTPPIMFTNTMRILQLFIVLIFLYLIYVDTKALIRKQESSFLNTLANMIIFLAIINDVLLYNQLFETIEMTSIGLFFYLFTQSIIIPRQFARSFKQSEELSRDLARLNASLEQQVYERTMELRDMNKELRTANFKLNEAHQSRSKWIRNIYHEIATPLTTIRAYTKGILDGVIQAERKYIQLVHEQSLYLSRMMNDLHDMTEIENREITFNRKKVNIREYVQRLYEKYKVDIEKQGITFLYEDSTAMAEEVFVLIDKHRIEQVIVNFLKNAQKYVNQGGIIKLMLEKNDQLIVKVEDNGVGISENDIDRVFDRFYKSRRQKGTENGSGLGLAISKEVIEYHGGKIGVKSKEGTGSCFYFTLPIVSTVPKTYDKQ